MDMEEKKSKYRAAFDELKQRRLIGPDAITMWEEMLPSPDGIRLRTTYCRPTAEGAYPTIVMRSCYPGQEPELLVRCEEFAMRGFAAVLQWCRGIGGSEGIWEPNVNDRGDGLNLLNHLENCDFVSSMGYLGASYLAFTGWVMGDSLPSKMRAMFLTVYGTDRHTSAYKDGLFRQDILTAWAMDNAGHPVAADYMESASYRPQVEVDEALWGGRLDWYRSWITNTSKSDDYWKSGFWKELYEIPSKMNIPVFVGEGWYDHHLGSALNGFNEFSEAAAACSTLRIGPWNHGTQPVIFGHPDAENAGSDELSEIMDWFTETLMEGKVPERRIHCYVIGADCWKDFPEYPFKQEKVKSFYLSENGGLTTAKDDAEEGARSYVYDPEHPLYSHGAESLFKTWDEIGSRLQPAPDFRSDVISFVSEPLNEDLTILGQIETELYVDSDAEDTCFTVKVMEVFEDGSAYNIRNGITTLAYRNGSPSRLTYTPGETLKICIRCWDIAWQMKKGSSLRLDISSSNFPEYAVHPNKAGIWSEIAESVPAVQRVHFGGACPSAVRLPVTEL